VDGWKDCNAFIYRLKQSRKEYAGVPPYLQFQLSMVHCSLKKNWKIKEINSS
jgi:hypothetical protein